MRTAELLIGVLGHDLRTPLSAIVTAAEALRIGAPADPRSQRIAEIICSSSARMSRLIAQLLDFATARLGRLPVRPQPTDLGDLCHAAMQEFVDRDVSVCVEPAGDLAGVWDPDRMLQVLSNLIGNAVSHGTPGQPVSVRLDGTHQDTVRLEVVNAGVLSREAHAALFTPFASSSGKSAGTGLGLFIVDRILRAHGGIRQRAVRRRADRVSGGAAAAGVGGGAVCRAARTGVAKPVGLDRLSLFDLRFEPDRLTADACVRPARRPRSRGTPRGGR